MLRLKDVKMKPKLICLFLLIGITPLLIGGWLISQLADDAIMSKTYLQIEAVGQIKKAQVENFFKERKDDIGGLLDSVATLRQGAFQKFESIQKLKKTYIEDYMAKMRSALYLLKQDTSIINALIEFNNAYKYGGDKIDSSEWEALEKKYDDRIQDIAEENGWHDIFFIHTDGSIVYTLKHESDLGMKLSDRKLKNSSLTKAFKAARSMDSDDILISDFEPYAPSGGQFVAFMITQIWYQDELKGYLAFKLPTDKINSFIQKRDGMGNTGETYLVGRLEGRTSYRSDRVVKNGKIGQDKTGEFIDLALSGKSGTDVKAGSTGNLEIVSYAPLNIAGLNWAVISTMSMEEAVAPVLEDETRDFYTKYINKYGYKDLYLINQDGYCFYSVNQKDDYRTNLLGGNYSNTNLGKLVKQVVKTKTYGIADFEPYAPAANEPLAFIAQPYLHNGEIEVIVALQFSVEPINNIMKEHSGMGKTGETYLVGSDKIMRSDLFFDTAKRSVAASFANPSTGSIDTEAVNNALSGQTGSKILNDYNGNSVLSAFSPLKIENITWALIAEINESEVKAPVRAMLLSIIKTGLIIAAIVVFMAYMIAKSISHPLAKGVEYANSVVKGNLAAEIDVKQKDEAGLLADALKEMIRKILEVVTNVKKSADHVSASSEQLALVSREMSSSSTEMSQGASEQSASAEEISASMEQMVASIQLNADNAVQTEKIALQSVEDAQKSGNAVLKTVNAMKQITGKILIIEEIARQTDLLALNAAVEAARAGSQGKGFAVVASEVRKLAVRSKKAAEEINNMSESSMSIAEDAGRMLDALVPNITKTAELVREISVASREQNTGAEQINDAIRQLEQVTQQSAGISEQTAASSEEMAATAEALAFQAAILQKAIRFFKIDDKSTENSIKEISEKKDFDSSASAKKEEIIEKKKEENKNNTDGYSIEMKEYERINDSGFEKY